MCSIGTTLAVKFDKGVMLVSETALYYGSLMKIPNAPTQKVIGETVVTASGDFADFQFLMAELEDLALEDQLADDGCKLTSPKTIYSYLKLIMYNKRSKFEPAMLRLTVAGMHNGEPFLGTIDSLGNHWTDTFTSGGPGGKYLLTGELRGATEYDQWKKMTRDDAKTLAMECMMVNFARANNAFNRVFVTTVTADGISTEIAEPPGRWEHKLYSADDSAVIR
eukprot:TRINITY_DN33263_c0_g1_i1.p1 TRINITY_DN33263_c0_g1~~TRINITY_DN33263_c0_g1_i1.p1  ORF type:complete len:245 (+),score=95.33 TRINITY_DN33263_c0_g1_i1:72-737(+)